ncbi:restriction endonuclease subunit S [Enterococcus cecorum]|uniref:restriction endonuclease subunit S n=1 Tax=Enterococcus cecorum TaxID=44008 RepID=UPI001FAC0E70|nr:restriction endonuclease subunit S [Enterococcus cecorum]MCJ0550798.1 restriction endonuclease subunit S [Enterococcus cecorum]
MGEKKNKKLGEICHIVSGGTPSRSNLEYWDNGNIPWIKIGDIKGKYINSASEFITRVGLDNSSAKLLKKGTILYTIFATLGEVGILDFDACTNQAIAGITIKEDINVLPDYLYYYLKSIKNRINKLGRGVAQNNINLSILKNLDIAVIEVNQQKEIIKTLDCVDSIIRLHKKELELLDTLIKARFVEMFGTLRANEKEFEIVTIQDVCSLIKDGTHQTPNYIDDKENGYKFLSSKDVMSQKIDWTNIKYIPRELHEKIYSRISPQKNDILMSKNGVNYGVAAVNDTDEIFDIYVSLALLRPTEKINPIFFRCVINNPETKWQFDSSIKGIGVPNLHLGEIKKTKILLPPRSLQNEFAAFVQQIDKLRFGGRKRLTKAKNTKNNNRNTITLERSTLYGK